MPGYLLAHDLGTSGNKATLFSSEGQLLQSVSYPYDTSFFNGNWAEQDACSWWKAVCSSTRAILQGYSPKDVAAVSFSGQMMGCVCVDRQGQPLRNAVIWADQRSVSQINRLKEKIDPNDFYKITGHRPSPSYSLGKLLWIRENEPDTYRHTYKMLNAKDYIIYKLTGEFVTDYSDASGTNLFDLNTFKWSDKIIDAAQIDGAKLPDLKPSTCVAGGITSKAAVETGLVPGTPVVCGGGDGVCAAVGAGCICENTAYNYVGSSSWIGLTSKEPIYDHKMRTFNWAHIVPGLISPCGTMQAAGASLSWLKNEICREEDCLAKETGSNVFDLINSAAEGSVPGSNGLIYLPYLLGERSPHWNENARGAFIGLKMEHKRSDILRAVIEGVFLNLNLILEIFREYAEFDGITVIGGGVKGEIQRRIMADIYGLNILALSHLEEATSMGAAITGGVGVGIFKDFDAISRFIEVMDIRKPDIENRRIYDSLKPVFAMAYKRLEPVYEALAAL